MKLPMKVKGFIYDKCGLLCIGKVFYSDSIDGLNTPGYECRLYGWYLSEQDGPLQVSFKPMELYIPPNDLSIFHNNQLEVHMI